MRPEFWSGRRVFLTGHTGFKGSWLSLWLQHLGVDLTGFALEPPTTPSLFEEAGIAAEMRSIHGDIRDAEALKKAMQAARPEIVIHMAAQPLVRLSYDDPVGTYATNVMGTVHTLEAVRATPSVRAVVNVTTDKCYQDRGSSRGYVESDAMGGYDPYSSSKACAELVSAAYRSSFFNPDDYGRHGVALATVRAGNVIGGGDWAQDRLIPDILAAFAQGRPVDIRNPDAVRPWQHVLEPLRGYLMLAERLVDDGAAFAEGWNFGPHDLDCRPVSWIVARLADGWGSEAQWRIDPGPKPHETRFLKLDSAKAAARLGWQPRWDLPRALDAIVAWHRGRLQGLPLRTMTLGQIHDYASAETETNH